MAISFFNDDIGIVVGDLATILRTVDGGMHWTEMDLPIEEDLIDVKCVADGHGIAVGRHGTILTTADHGATWIIQSTGATFNYAGVDLQLDGTGFIVGFETLRTTDFGATWDVLPFGGSMTQVASLGDTVLIVNDNGVTRQSFDAGETWATRNSGVDSECRPLILDSAIMFIYGRGGFAEGTISRSMDGGLTWTPQSVGDSRVVSVLFRDSLNGTALNATSHYFHTTDGGLTWGNAVGELPDLGVYGMAFDGCITASGMHAVGDIGYIWGLALPVGEWELRSTGFQTNLNAVEFAAPGVAFICGWDGFIARTDDYGLSWTTQNSGVAGDLYDIQFLDANEGWIVGESAALHTIDGGTTWANMDSIGLLLRSVHFMTPSTGVVTGMSGVIRRTTDGGANWTSITSPGGFIHHAVEFYGADTGYIANETEVLRTTNGGLDWEPIPQLQLAYSDIHMFSATEVIVIGTSINSFRKTMDGGNTWIPMDVPSALGFTGPSIDFVDADTGYAVGNQGRVMMTSDGGLTWAYDAWRSDQYLNDIAFDAEGNGMYVGDMGHMLGSGMSLPLGLSPKDRPDAVLFPVPAANELHLQNAEEWAGASYLIHDMGGRALGAGTWNGGQSSIDVRALPAGIYTLTLKNKRGLLTERFMKQ